MPDQEKRSAPVFGAAGKRLRLAGAAAFLKGFRHAVGMAVRDALRMTAWQSLLYCAAADVTLEAEECDPISHDEADLKSMGAISVDLSGRTVLDQREISDIKRVAFRWARAKAEHAEAVLAGREVAEPPPRRAITPQLAMASAGRSA